MVFQPERSSRSSITSATCGISATVIAGSPRRLYFGRDPALGDGSLRRSRFCTNYFDADGIFSNFLVARSGAQDARQGAGRTSLSLRGNPTGERLVGPVEGQASEVAP
jgi:hypothetical protein